MDFSHAAIAIPTVIIALALSATLGSFIVTLVFRLADRADQKTHQKSGEAQGERLDDNGRATDTLMRGGLTIGILERIAVTALILAGYPQGIGFVVAIKGLGRFHELRDHGPRASEKFVIGTLASCLWAAGIGLGAQALITAWS